MIYHQHKFVNSLSHCVASLHVAWSTMQSSTDNLQFISYSLLVIANQLLEPTYITWSQVGRLRADLICKLIAAPVRLPDVGIWNMRSVYTVFVSYLTARASQALSTHVQLVKSESGMQNGNLLFFIWLLFIIIFIWLCLLIIFIDFIAFLYDYYLLSSLVWLCLLILFIDFFLLIVFCFYLFISFNYWFLFDYFYLLCDYFIDYFYLLFIYLFYWLFLHTWPVWIYSLIRL